MLVIRRWLRPTLSQRLVTALLTAILLLAALVLVQDQLDLQKDLHAGVQELGLNWIAGLDELDDPVQAAKLMAGQTRRVNEQRLRHGLSPGDLIVQLYDNKASLLYASAPGEAIAKPGLGEQTLGGRQYWTYRHDGARWSLRIAEPTLPSTRLLGFASWELGKQLLLAFPLMLLPLWLAVRSGLRPLRRLTQKVEGLDLNRQLEPLKLDLRYAELQPLGNAFDTLLLRLRERLQREQAFVHDAAHELRTPLAVVAAQAHALLQAPDAPSRAQASEALLHAISRSAHLSEQLLSMASLDQAAARAPEPFDAAALCTQLLAQQAGMARESGLALGLEAPEHLELNLDRLAFQSVLQNLVDNALRYVPRGGRIEVLLRQDETGLQLSVADDGPGIPEADREQVFERFWRGKGHDQPGTGLGLAIVRQAAQHLGGELRLAEGLGQRGLRVSLRLPGRR
ncbi:HAMP domain-containing histidine kinase [Pelomonas sp. V22]|uniref:sensor histidine kinase n=1 Tax=Pelomonas sp. V22 TaxID=2822139 RepID=UPI0024A90D39|nr:HAMP domain-containing sensor histidine kinase [Pelomonas sp. V22]MDI4633747.1 HAMP domain-containing histidine kinase [Pelomonas sp. V22]